MSFSGAFGRENENKYVSNLEFEVIKGRRTRIDTLFKLVTDLIYEFEVGVALPDLEPVRVIGAYNKLANGHTVEASFSKADKLYRTFGEVIYEPGQTYKCLADVSVPDRRVKVMLGSSLVGSEKHVHIDCQWNVDVNLDDRVLANLTYDVKGIDDFEIATTFHYPSRTIDFSVKHNSADRYITNVELAWSPQDKMEINVIFRDDYFSGAERTELDVSFKSPFKRVQEIGMSSSVIRFPAQVQTKSSVTWAPGKKILVSSTVKTPFSINSVDFSGSISTPFKGFTAMSTVVNHRFNKGEVNSNAFIQWGRNRVSISTDGKLRITGLKRVFQGDLEVRTPFEGFRTFSLGATHEDNYKKFTTKFTMDTSKFNNPNNDEKYTLEMDMDHNQDFGMSNIANIRIKMPNDDITADWEVSLLMGSSRAMIDILPRRGNRFKVELAETHMILPTGNKITSKFELRIPTEAIQELLLSFSHEDRKGFVNTSASLTKDNLELANAKIEYMNSHSSVKLNSLITSAYTEDVVVKLTSAHSIMPYKGDLEMRWGDTPWKVTADMSIMYDQFGRHDTMLRVYTPLPAIQVLSVGFKREKVGLNWEAQTTLSYAQQNLKFKTVYRHDHVKFTKVIIETNFRQFPGLTTSVRLDGNVENFNGDASFVMFPYVPKVSTDFKWSYYEGSRISGNFNLNTHFPRYPYMKLKFDSNQLGMSRVSNFELEYLPTQIIKAELDHRFTSLETLEGTLKVTSPFTENKELIAGFTHVGNMQEFTTKAKITCDCIRRPVFVESTFSSKKGIMSTFTMNSPFRGYETVNWNLKHESKGIGYHTVASYETNGKKISYENLLTLSSENMEWQITFLTPFANITRTHLLLSQGGMFPNTKTHAEVAYNENTIAADISLKHHDTDSAVIVDVTTPFKRYETISAKLSKSGTLSDFAVTGDLNYGRPWHTELIYRYNKEDVLTTVLLQCPYLEDDVTMKFNYTGPLLDSHLTLDYNMGVYNTVYETRLLYDLPNLVASSKFTTKIQDQVRVNILALKHLQKLSPAVEIHSQLEFQNKDVSRVNLELYLNSLTNLGNMELTSYLIAELPHPDFKYSKMSYEAKREVKQTRQLQKTGYMFTFETPLLEKITEESSEDVDFQNLIYEGKMKRTYGDMEWTSDTFMKKGYVTYKFTTPHEGYESGSVEITYTHPEKDQPIVNFNSDIVVKATGLNAPITISTKHNNEFYGNSVSGMDGSVTVKYSKNRDMSITYNYVPGSVTGNLKTDIEGYESSDVMLQYTQTNAQVNIKSSALTTPITYTGMYKTESWTDFEVSSKFNSGFTNFTHLEFVLRNVIMDRTYRPKISFKYEDGARQMKDISMEGTWAWDVEDTGNMKIATGLYMKAPYPAFNELNVRLSHEHTAAPLTVEEGITIGFNSKKYLDADAKFGAKNRFSGLVTFRSPRVMEYSFSALNEGESVDADIMLNWNKADSKSNFRMEFDLSDTGDQMHKKKNFHMRIINPGRTIGVSFKFENNKGNVKSQGGLAWNERNGKEVTYDFGTALTRSGLRDVELTVTVPTRSVEMSGTYKVDESTIYGSGSLLWDAGAQRDKRVEMKLEVLPQGVTKKATLDVKLPSFNKVSRSNTCILYNHYTNYKIIIYLWDTFSVRPLFSNKRINIIVLESRS